MNKSDLINVVKEQAGLSRKEAEQAVLTFFNEISSSLEKGNRVEIRGFGSFTVKRYKSYTGRNPKTGAPISVPEKKLPFFKVGKELKGKVDL
ncbi:MAG: HU family DNA-binding protein [Desulfobacteraceae bacterium]|jgi:integration host factor subunit beta|nr:HU family DNA-binding protein [Desulfobacteraceae bacterium]